MGLVRHFSGFSPESKAGVEACAVRTVGHSAWKAAVGVLSGIQKSSYFSFSTCLSHLLWRLIGGKASL